MTRAARQRRRTTAALAASAAAHLAIFGLLALYTPVFQPLWVAPRDFQIELVPTLPLAAPSGQAKRAGAAAETASQITPRKAKAEARHTNVQTTTPYPLPTRGAAAQTPRPPSPISRPTPTPPPARIGLPGAELGGSTSSAPAWPAGVQGAPAGGQTEGDNDGAGVRGALRTSVGCDDPDYYNLSKAEIAKCHRDFGVQAAIGSRMYVDPIRSAKVRNQYDKAREACERLNHYATPLDSDREHSAKAPGNWGLDKLKC
jgi:hypothetical protein